MALKTKELSNLIEQAKPQLTRTDFDIAPPSKWSVPGQVGTAQRLYFWGPTTEQR
jgi:hypothetical protein